MVLGTASGVGKSLITAGLCRIFSDWGYRVAPFKAQNMSNNSFVTEEGGEIGRAQAVQAECARVKATVDMNPVLLKPAGDNGSQVVVHGRAIGHFTARDYYAQKRRIAQAIRESYERLAEKHEILIIEGAGSPAEINLKENDLVNMKMAELAEARCVLVGDIDRGGVFASFIGTLELLNHEERARIDAFIINKFRGDASLLEDGIQFLEKRTGKKVWGLIPYDRELWIEEEDTVSVGQRVPMREGEVGDLDIAVILVPRLSNFTDFEVLRQEKGVRLTYVRQPAELERRPDLLILPGTKATISDFHYLVEKGFHAKILEFVREGGKVLGICGGYQMMGKLLRDPSGVESEVPETPGLGLLNMTTEFTPEKVLRQVETELDLPLFGERVQGLVKAYEIHMGRTVHYEAYGPFGSEGAVHPSGRIAGTYLHGLWDSAPFRSSFLSALARSCGKEKITFDSEALQEIKERHCTRLARLVLDHLNLDLLLAWLPSSSPILREIRIRSEVFQSAQARRI